MQLCGSLNDAEGGKEGTKEKKGRTEEKRCKREEVGQGYESD